MSEVKFLTADEAVAALERCASPTDDGPVVHSIGLMGGLSLGADWSLDSAIEAARSAHVIDGIPQIGWGDTLFGRCLILIRNGRAYGFDGVTEDVTP